MKPPSKKLWIALITAVLIIIAITVVTGKDVGEEQQLAESNIVFINASREEIGSVGIHFPRWDGVSESGASMNADGSMLRRGDRLYFDAGGWPVTVTAYGDQQGNDPLAAVVIEQEPPSGEGEQVWYVIARDGERGLELTLSLNLDVEELERMQNSISRKLGVDLSAGVISYCWWPGHGWQGDGEDFVTMEFSRQDGDELERQIAETKMWEPFPIPEGLKACFLSVYDHESHIDWNGISHSGWHYFDDEQEQRHPAQSGDRYDSWDYVAAVYDREHRTLHFFEWHQ